jgi:anti-sigma-K factor RskA
VIHDDDMAAAYVLDALSFEELEEFEAHLAGCQQCQAEVAELRQVVDVLPLAVEPIEPPASLRDRILAAAEFGPDERPRLGLVPGGKQTSAAGTSRRHRLPTALLAAAAAVVIAGLGIRDLELQNTQTPQQSLQAEVTAALANGATASPVGGTATAPRATASLIQASHRAYLVVRGLHPSPTNKVYQVWYVHGTAVKSAGVFTYSHGSEIIPLPRASGNDVTAVTMEPGPRGSKLPTGPKVLVGTVHA